MKVLITTDLYNVSTNGVVTSVRNLMEELEAKGHEVRVLTFSEDRYSYKDGNIYYIKSPCPPVQAQWLSWSLQKWKPNNRSVPNLCCGWCHAAGNASSCTAPSWSC